jgi:hypothetical protein
MLLLSLLVLIYLPYMVCIHLKTPDFTKFRHSNVIPVLYVVSCDIPHSGGRTDECGLLFRCVMITVIIDCLGLVLN